jgi:hypothetical protein
LRPNPITQTTHTHIVAAAAAEKNAFSSKTDTRLTHSLLVSEFFAHKTYMLFLAAGSVRMRRRRRRICPLTLNYSLLRVLLLVLELRHFDPRAASSDNKEQRRASGGTKLKAGLPNDGRGLAEEKKRIQLLGRERIVKGQANCHMAMSCSESSLPYLFFP